MKEKQLSAVIVMAFLAMTLPAAATTLVGPGINNGSFESPAESGNWNNQQGDPAFTFWRGGTGDNPFNHYGNGRIYLHTLPDAYTLAASDGGQLLNLSNSLGGAAGMFPGFMASDVIQTPIAAGTSLTLSTAFGFNPGPIQARSTGWGGYLGQAIRLYEVNPANFGIRNMILELISRDSTAPNQGTWRTLSAGVNMPTDGWYLQLELEVGDLDGNLVADSSDPGYDFSWHMVIENVVLVCTALDPHILALTPPLRIGSSAAGSTGFDVSNNGSATGMVWTASVTSGGSWLSISDGFAGVDDGTITAVFTENTGSQRSGEITVTGATSSPQMVTVTQSAQIPSTMVKVLIDEDNTLWHHSAGSHHNLGDLEEFGRHILRLGEMATNEEKYYPILRATDIVSQLQAAGVVHSSQIYSGALNLYVSGIEQDFPGSYAVTIHRLTSDWVEGTADWVVQAGSSDWYHPIHDTAAWNTPGGDIGPPLSYQDFFSSTADLTFIQITGLADTIKYWFDNPSENYGMQVRMDMTTQYPWGTSPFGQTAFYSSESLPLHGGHPEFEIGFTPLAADCEQIWQDGLGIDVDLNRDCYVDLNDLLLLFEEWLMQINPTSFAP